MLQHILFFLLLSFFFSFSTLAQTPELSAAEIELALKNLQVNGSVLYIAAHPDDENTRMIAYLATHKGYHTGYLSLTRGDGGQNLIGPEVREQLGLIRTQELLAARRTDGGEQFFSRANDFGYSKHPDETFSIWDEEKVLADAVWAIRKFRPDVIVTRFSPDRAGKTHGHHTASARIALEAFEAAADPERFPKQLKYVGVWQTRRLFWNTSWWFYRNKPEEFEKAKKTLLTMDVGAYNPLLGESIGEVASRSRSMHRSQGFGASLQRGENLEFLKLLKGDSAKTGLFENINTDWNRYEGGAAVERHIRAALARFTPSAPHRILPELLQAHRLLTAMQQVQPETTYQLQQLEKIILACAGFWADATSSTPEVAVGDSLKISLRAIRRSPASVRVSGTDFQLAEEDTVRTLAENKFTEWSRTVVLPEDFPISQPYWLQEAGTKGMFTVEEQTQIGLPENPAAVSVELPLEIRAEGVSSTVRVRLPVQYREVRPDEGERYRPLAVVPPLTVSLQGNIFLFSDEKPQEVRLTVKSFQPESAVTVRLRLPEGWRSEPSEIPVQLEGRGSEKEVSFQLFPPENQQESRLQAVVSTGDKTYTRGFQRIDYRHIPVQTLFPQAQAKIVRVSLQKRPDENIAYLMGAGDQIPEALRQIGYSVTLLDPNTLTEEELAQYSTVIIGVRAYNTVPRLKFLHEKLMNYVKGGGNLITQYNTSYRLLSDTFGPYPLKLSRDRVTVEEAPMRILAPEHRVLTHPNKITEADFEGWVQERGLYFPDEWDEQYTPIFSCNDPGEDPKKGSLLIAEYGKGTFVYTGLSFFRELPAGVAGAYRLFVNLVSLRGEEQGE